MNSPVRTDWIDADGSRVRAAQGRRSVIGRGFTGVARVATRGQAYEVFRMLSLNRKLFRAYISFNARLMPFGSLYRADTERLILRVAWRCRSRYEWEQHRLIARRVGVPEGEIDAIGTLDPVGAGVPARTGLLLRACDELLDQHVLATETWLALRAELDEAAILELCMLVGNYAMLAGALNSFGVPLEPAHTRRRRFRLRHRKSR